MAFDIDAFCNYCVIILVGSVTAMIAMLAPFPPGPLRRQAWQVPASWAVFFGYLAAPVLLFWLLDATGVSTDTSFVTAVIVAVTSHQILGGADPKVQVSEGLTGWWRKFLRFSETTAAQVQARSLRDRRNFYDHAIQRLRSNDAAFAALVDFVRTNSDDVTSDDAALAKIDTEAKAAKPPLSDDAIRERKSRWLMRRVAVYEDAEWRMKEAGIIPPRLYYMILQGWRSTLIAAAVLTGIVATAAIAAYSVLPKDWEASYSVLRLSKPNATDTDVYRARRRLEQVMVGTPERADAARQRLVAAVRRPAIDVKRVELMLGLAIMRASDPAATDLVARDLIPGLRSTLTDARARVQQVLTFLAEHATPKRTPVKWDPLKEASAMDVENAVRQWELVWATPAEAPAAGSPPQ